MSTLYFVPEFLKDLLEEEEKEGDDKRNEDELHTNNRQNRSIPLKNPYELRSKASNTRCVNRVNYNYK